MYGIHPSAVLSPNVCLGENVTIGPNCSIGFPGFQFHEGYDAATNTLIGDGTVIMGNSVICIGSAIGNNCRLDYHSYIGEQSFVGDFCVVEYGGRIYDEVTVGSHSTISGFICNETAVGTNSIVQGDLIHKFSNVEVDKKERSPIVCNSCFIGKRSLIIGGITIADGSYISAGAVVTKDTKPNQLYSGNPAKEIGSAPKSYLEGVERFNEKRIARVHEIIRSYTWI